MMQSRLEDRLLEAQNNQAADVTEKLIRLCVAELSRFLQNLQKRKFKIRGRAIMVNNSRTLDTVLHILMAVTGID